MKEPRFELRPGEYVVFSHLPIPALQEIASGQIAIVPGTEWINDHSNIAFAMAYAARLLKDYLS